MGSISGLGASTTRIGKENFKAALLQNGDDSQKKKTPDTVIVVGDRTIIISGDTDAGKVASGIGAGVKEAVKTAARATKVIVSWLGY